MKYTVSALITCFLLLTAVSCHAQQEPQPADILAGVEAAISTSLPAGWTITQRTINEIPWGHHWCEDYKGVTGIKLVVKGVRPVKSEVRGKDGIWQAVPVAIEALNVWLMPGNYADSFWAWTCIHRPIQPVVVVKRDLVHVYVQPSHVITSEEEFKKLLSQCTEICWPDSPMNARDSITWKTWRKDIAKAIADVDKR